MDLFQMLESHNLGLITRQILYLLSLHDLLVCTRVSNFWNAIILENYEKLFRETTEETESKWLNGKLSETKIDLSKHLDGCLNSLKGITTLCCCGYTFFFSPKPKRYSAQSMIVFCGSNFVSQVTLPSSEASQDKKETFDSCDWEFIDILEYDAENFVLLAKGILKQYKPGISGGELKQNRVKLVIQLTKKFFINSFR